MNYQEFLDYIYQRHSGNVKLGLERMMIILQEMGEPNLHLQGIHVAGTNGKGSTCAMCEAMCLAHGLTTGMNTSPHLVDYRERFRLNGNNISLDELITNYKKWEPILEANEASFFEITTALAFYIFLQKKVDAAIMEVGLGGRLDGTKPFASTVTVISSISFDHTKSLGDTLEKIAFEKAGIIKKNTPLVLGKLPAVAEEVILQIARENQAPVLILGRDFHIENVRIDAAGTTFDYISKDLKLLNLTVNLLGKHQAANAALAITAFRIFRQKTGKAVSEENIRLALNRVEWMGRMQIIAQQPTVILDGAHNEEGVTSLKENILQLFPNKKIYFVFAILRDKNLAKMIQDICGISYKIFIAKNHSQRAAEIEEQEDIVKKYHSNYEVIHDVVEASRAAISQADKNDIVMISGSLYTISEVLKVKDTLNN
ncbi:MAG TPA: folylpolyglutamate synthase/dihydrofolate synthase family protein [Candidatus Cloacimonadota bacterium]|nr:folylpolyglutamate synthase/dihydrofolate synthase family protein [Candidatus Cloacimonadota bacterium]